MAFYPSADFNINPNQITLPVNLALLDTSGSISTQCLSDFIDNILNISEKQTKEGNPHTLLVGFYGSQPMGHLLVLTQENKEDVLKKAETRMGYGGSDFARALEFAQRSIESNGQHIGTVICCTDLYDFDLPKVKPQLDPNAKIIFVASSDTNDKMFDDFNTQVSGWASLLRAKSPQGELEVEQEVLPDILSVRSWKK